MHSCTMRTGRAYRNIASIAVFMIPCHRTCIQANATLQIRYRGTPEYGDIDGFIGQALEVTKPP